jgi:Spy/CpxP family protein refolding chaperone
MVGSEFTCARRRLRTTHMRVALAASSTSASAMMAHKAASSGWPPEGEGAGEGGGWGTDVCTEML